MHFFYRNTYSNLLQQKFVSTPSKFKSQIFAEVCYKDLESLSDESVLKCFYFFFLIFGVFPAFKSFTSRYHLGKTFYNFRVFKKFEVDGVDLFLLHSFLNNLNESDKISFNSKIYFSNLQLVLSDLKSFYLIESNPHFFKWEKELSLSCSPVRSRGRDTSDFSFFLVENFKNNNFKNFWSYYAS